MNSKLLVNTSEDFFNNPLTYQTLLNKQKSGIALGENDKFYNRDYIEKGPCTKGEYIDIDTVECKPCDATSYNDQANAFSCKKCNPNKFTFTEGATDENDCREVPDSHNEGTTDALVYTINNYKKYDKYIPLHSSINKGYSLIKNKADYINETNESIKDLTDQVNDILNTI